MRNIICIILIFAMFLFLGTKVEDSYMNDVEKLHKEILYPTVRVIAKDSGGSGTVIYSKKDESGKIRTFILTNHHVIEDLITIKKQWNSLYKKEIKTEVTSLARVDIFKYNNYSSCVGSFQIEAEIKAYSHSSDGYDVALLELKDTESVIGNIANLYPKDKIDDIHIFDEVWACGAALLHPPIATRGIISFMDDIIDNHVYWMSTANIIYGNSGGAVYRFSSDRNKYEYIGIPARISISGWKDAVTHMGYFVPITNIYKILDENCYQFIYDSNYTYEQCEKMRKEKRDKENKRMMFMEDEKSDVSGGDN